MTMNLVNYGTLYADKPLGSKAKKLIRDAFGNSGGVVTFNGQEIEVSEAYGSALDFEINCLIDQLSALGIQLEGRISYYGDYDGAYAVEKGKYCDDLCSEELAIIDADDDTLSAELERRGFTVGKAG